MQKATTHGIILSLLFLFIFTGVQNTLGQNGPGGVGDTTSTADRLKIWLRADQNVFSDGGNTPASNGGSVQQWNDKTANNFHVTQINGTNKPTFKTGLIAGKPAIRFDGNNDYLQNFSTTYTARTVFVVYRIDDVLASQQNFGQLWGDYGGGAHIAADSRNNSFQFGFSFDGNGSAKAVYALDGKAKTTTPEENDNTQKWAFNEFTFVVAEFSNGQAMSRNILGSTEPALSNFELGGDIAEVIVYNTTLSGTDRSSVEKYLFNKYKYGFEAGFPGNINGIGHQLAGITQNVNQSSVMKVENISLGEGLYFFGHDNDPITLIDDTDPSVSELPLGNNAVLDRVWRTDLTGTGGEVTVKVDVSTIVSELASGESFRLLVMDDFLANDYANAEQLSGTLVGDTLIVENIPVNKDTFYSLGKVIAGSNSTFYSFKNGEWGDPGTWTTDPSGLTQVPTGGQVPPDGSSVAILNGDTVTIPDSDTQAKDHENVVIESGGIVDLTSTTGHLFANVAGGGLLRANSTQLPEGDYTDFSSMGNGTVEFYNVSGTLPASSATYNNLLLTNSTETVHTISLENNVALNGNLETRRTGAGTLTLTVGNNTTARSLTVQGNTTIGEGTIFNVGSDDATHNISFYGDVINNGTIDFKNGNGEANAHFKGANNSSLFTNGMTDLFNLILDKGIDQTFKLTVTSTADNFNLTANNNRLQIKNGTLILGSQINITLDGGNFDIGFDQNTNGALVIDGANVELKDAMVVYGLFELRSGFIRIPREGLVTRVEGQILINGGTIDVSKYRVSGAAENRGSFTMNGGIMNIDRALGNSNNAYAAFSLPFLSQSFIMTGGTINVLYAENSGTAANGGIQIGADPANVTVTGGTWNITIPNSATDFGIASSAPFFNLNVNRQGTTGSGVALIRDLPFRDGVVTAADLQVLNNFTLSSTNSPTFDINGYNAFFKSDIVINSGSNFVNTGAENTVTLNQVATQKITLDASVIFDNLTIKTGDTAFLSGTANPFIKNTLTIDANTKLDNGGLNIIALGNVTNSGTITNSGSLVLAGDTTSQTISGNNGKISNLKLDNSNGVVGSVQIKLLDNLTITDSLILNKDRLFDIDASLLHINAGAVITPGASNFSSERMIITGGISSNAGIKKQFTPSGGSFTYPFGTGTLFTPAIITVTNADGSGGSITARPVASEQPNVTVEAVSLGYYWRVSSAGFGVNATFTHIYTYDQSDVVGTEANYIFGRFDPGSLTWNSGSTDDVDETNNIIGGAGTGLENVPFVSGDFTAGEAAAFGAVTVFYSRQSGAWNTQSTWSNDGVGGPEGVGTPGLGDPVIIGDATTSHTITVQPAESATAGNISIASGSILDLGSSTGNDLGTLLQGTNGSGYGIIRLSTGTFPAGDFSNFVASGAGTFEYYRNGNNFTLSSVQKTYNNLVFSTENGNSGTITLPAANLTINGNLQVGKISNLGNLTVLTDATSARTINISNNLLVRGASTASSTLTLTAGADHTINVNNDLTVSNNGNFNVQNSGTNTHLINLSGNLANGGGFDLRSSGTVADVVFSGKQNKTVTGEGTPFEFNNLTLNKGSDTLSVLDVTAPNLTIRPGGLLLQNGTFKLSSAQVLNLGDSQNFTIPVSSQLWVNGTSVIVTGTSSIFLNGKLQITNSGIANFADGTNNNVLQYTSSGTAELIVKSGTLTINSQIRRSTSVSTGGLIYKQSGGTVTVGKRVAPVGKRGVFEIVNGGSFTMSGGTLTIVRAQSSASVASLLLQPETASVTGGVVQIGNDTDTPTNQSITINSTAPLWDVTINSTNSPTAQLHINGLAIRNDLLIESGANFNANGLALNIGRNFTNNSTFASNGNTTTFNGVSANQVITGNTSFHNLIIDNTQSGGHVEVNNSYVFTLNVNNNMELLNGRFEVNQSTINARGDITLSSDHLSSNGGKIVLNAPGARTITGNGNGTFDNVEIANGGGYTAETSFGITGTLTLTEGVLNLKSNKLTLTETSDVSGSFSSTRMIATNGSSSDDGITKIFPDGATPDFTFPIGVGSKFTPARFNILANTGAGNQITIRPVNQTNAASTDDDGDGNDLLKYFWDVTSSGFSGLNVIHEYTYSEGDVQDGSDTQDGDSGYEAGKFNGGVWSSGPTNLGNVDNISNLITINGGSSGGNSGVGFIAGQFTAGELEEFGTLATFTSIQSGNWDDPATWDQNGVPDGNPVVISPGDVVNTNGNSRTSSTMDLQGTLDIDTSIGHNFGTVSGTGTLIVASSNFPAGEFSNFVDSGGGTVQYKGNITLPARTTYNNLTINDASTKILPNVDIIINGNFNVSDPNAVVDASVNNRNISLTGDWTLTGINNFLPGTGRVTFNSASTQNITGSTNFYDLYIKNTSLNGVDVNNNLTIENDLVFQSGILNTGANNLTVSGDITNNSTASSLNPGSGTIILNGNEIQTVGGTSALTFNNLTVNNTTTTGINLTHSITVNNTLEIVDGNINTGSNLIMLGASNGTIQGETNAKRVVGSIQVSRNVGTGSSGMGNIGVNISAKAGNNMGNVTIKRVTGSEGVVTINGGTSIATRWVIDADNQPKNRQITYSWLSADDNGKDMTRMRLFRRDNEGTGSFSTITNFLDVSGSNPRNLTATVNSFSEFATSDDESTLPVELIEFNSELDGSTERIILTWSTATEKENFGFFVNRAFLPAVNENSGFKQDTVWSEIGFVEGAGTTLERQDYRFIDSGIDQAGNYLYRLKQVDFGGLSEYFGPIELELEAPERPELQRNYPNPFNPTTNITYKVSRTSRVQIQVYNILGQLVTTLVDQQNQPGTFTVVFDGSGLTSGMYLVRMQVDGSVFTRKVMLIK